MIVLENKGNLKTIVFACGGTLGHINPAIAMAKYLKDKYRIIFFSTMKEKNNKTYADFDYNIYYYNCQSFNRHNIINNIKAIKNNIKAIKNNIIVIKEIKKTLKKENVDLVISMGSSIGTLAVIASFRIGIKTLLHEQNAVLGLGNKIVLRKVDKVLLSYPIDKIKNYTVVGNPVISKIKEYHKEGKQILIFGGSLGAERINDFFIDNYKNIKWPLNQVVLITGEKYYQKNIEKINKVVSYNFKILKKVSHMNSYYNDAYIVICRGGATTISEVLQHKKCAIIIPSPNVTLNHQYYNALYYVKRNCLLMIEEKNINVDSINLLLNKLDNKKERAIINNNITLNVIQNTKEKFFSEIKKIIGE